LITFTVEILALDVPSMGRQAVLVLGPNDGLKIFAAMDFKFLGFPPRHLRLAILPIALVAAIGRGWSYWHGSENYQSAE